MTRFCKFSHSMHAVCVLLLSSIVAKPVMSNGYLHIDEKPLQWPVVSVLNRGTVESPDLEIRLVLNEYFASRFLVMESRAVHHDADKYLGVRLNFVRQAEAWLFDFHPFRGNFRGTAGLLWNRNALAAGFGLNRLEYTIEAIPGSYGLVEPVVDAEFFNGRANVSFDRLAAYLGVGWANKPRQMFEAGRWLFSVDLGVIYHGKPHVDLMVQGDLIDGLLELEEEIQRVWSYPLETTVAQAIDGQRLELENRLSDKQLLPYYALGMTSYF